ncbi:hypothetical protein EJ08DRAFT_451718 [Tothia fuscella]|uniref:Uncharacterized protein n=1 Tax=Tothia fuscella TaxID=1048955 RepID=A0A9P4TTU7_9PEZI|nr:hypothetical protein EJ08DRAFT_451718 [Tothia fuscella]
MRSNLGQERKKSSPNEERFAKRFVEEQDKVWRDLGKALARKESDDCSDDNLGCIKRTISETLKNAACDPQLLVVSPIAPFPATTPAIGPWGAIPPSFPPVSQLPPRPLITGLPSILSQPILQPPTTTELPLGSVFGLTTLSTSIVLSTLPVNTPTPTTSVAIIWNNAATNTAFGATNPTNQAQKSNSIFAMPPMTKGLMAFGIILGAVFVAFIASILVRRKRRGKRTESRAYSDIETVYRNDAESAFGDGRTDRAPRLALPSFDMTAPAIPQQVYQQQRESQIQQRSSLQIISGMKEDPFADPVNSRDNEPRSTPVPLQKNLPRKQVGSDRDGNVLPQSPKEDEVDPGRTSVREFHTTPSWVTDQLKRLENL